MPKQCPKCGVMDTEKSFMDSFCTGCYLSMNMPTLPAKITIYRCRACGNERFTAWTTPVDESIAHELRSKRFGTPEVRLEERRVMVKYNDISTEFCIPLKVKDSICNTCSQKSAGYYEAIIQLRGKYAHDRIFAGKIMRQLEHLTFIPKTEELKEGLDIYVGSKQAVVAVLTALNLRLMTSNKLYGVKDGRRIYRTTFLVRG